MIKCIFFDVGGVYMKGDFRDFLKKAKDLLNVSKTNGVANHRVFDADYNKGRISIEECFSKFFGIGTDDSNMGRLVGYWSNTWKPEKEMMELVKKLKKNYKLAILSNSDPVNSAKYEKEGWYSFFDELILSHKEGILKPDPEIYMIALERTGMKPEECLFIDDQKIILEPARKLGMKTIHFKNIDRLKDDLVGLGVHL